MSRARRLLTWTLRLTLVLVGSGPLLVWALRDVPLVGGATALLDGWFQYQCHRDPSRSERWFGSFLPVCDRCLGIYLGMGLGALLDRPRLEVRWLQLWMGAAALAMVLDVASEAVGLRPPWAPLRLVTGLALAFPVGPALLRLVRGD